MKSKTARGTWNSTNNRNENGLKTQQQKKTQNDH